MLSIVIQNMGLLCSKQPRYSEADAEENAQAAEIERRIEQETKAEKHVQKLLLLGMCSFVSIMEQSTNSICFCIHVAVELLL
uniref:GTP-binding protein P alpha subunit gpa1 n=1 Tax=Rhizophora mucronata TaxID=61149 RepID=A0A2P2KR20_RHIMU